jgi:hypothetical protein
MMDVIFLNWGMVVKWRKNRQREYVMYLYSLEPHMWDEM